jgi:hypothetical protein
MVCGELIVSKSATIPGYLLSLSGTAVVRTPMAAMLGATEIF